MRFIIYTYGSINSYWESVGPHLTCLYCQYGKKQSRGDTMSLYGLEESQSESPNKIVKALSKIKLWKYICIFFLMLSTIHFLYWLHSDYTVSKLFNHEHDWVLTRELFVAFITQITLLLFLLFSKKPWIIFVAAIPPIINIICLSTLQYDGESSKIADYMKSEFLGHIRNSFISNPSVLYSDLVRAVGKESYKTFFLVEALLYTAIFYLALHLRWKDFKQYNIKEHQ